MRPSRSGFLPRPDPAATSPWEIVAQQAWDAAARLAGCRVRVRQSARSGRRRCESLCGTLLRARAHGAGGAARSELVHPARLHLPGRRDHYRPPIAEVLRRREGVCQDFTHLMISALRGFGVPARYVSGYIRTRPSRGGCPTRRRSVARLGRRLARTASMAGWISIPPTASWCGTNTSCWAGAAISATSRRCAASSWAAGTRS